METALLTSVLALPQAFIDAEDPNAALEAVAAGDTLAVGRIACAVQLLRDEEDLKDAVQTFRETRPMVDRGEVESAIRAFLRHPQVAGKWQAFRQTLRDKSIQRFGSPSTWVPLTPEQKFQEAIARRDGDFRAVDLTQVQPSMLLEALAGNPTLFQEAFLNPRMRWLNLEGANLRGARLYSADLSGTNLAGADLRQARLVFAKMAGTLLRDALLHGANLKGAIISDADAQGVVLQRADLSLSNLSTVDFERADFRNANLFGATLYNLRIAGADFSGADLRKTKIKKADFQGQGALFSDTTQFDDDDDGKAVSKS